MRRIKKPALYSPEYFKELGFENEAAEQLAKNYIIRPQTPQEIRQGIMTERKNREESAIRAITKNLEKG